MPHVSPVLQALRALQVLTTKVSPALVLRTAMVMVPVMVMVPDRQRVEGWTPAFLLSSVRQRHPSLASERQLAA